MEKFAGRVAELKYLEQYYAKEGSQLLVVYGNKGVGKTALMREFCRGKKHSYYLGRACSEREQRGQWTAELKEQKSGLGTSAQELGRYPEWEELFEAAAEHIRSEQSDDSEKRAQSFRKQVLVIDEFHHLVKGDEAFFPALVRFVEDRLLSRPVLVALVTSASGWVENSMVGKLGSSAAAIAGFLKLRELSFENIRELYPEYSEEDALGCFAVLGGIPGYWKNLSRQCGVRENIVRNLLAKESRLYSEMSVFLEQELREPAVYNTILSAMARGCNKLNDIYRHTGFSRAKISVYLKNLMELDLVEKVYSYETAGHANTQKGVYRILNPYVCFYFRYLFPNQSALELLTAEEFYREKIEASFEVFVEEAYRRICREKIGLEYRTTGEWLGKTGGLDIVASDAQKNICVAACCYSRKMTYADYEWLLYSMKKAKVKSGDVRLYCEKGFEDALIQEAEAGKVRLLQIMDNKGR